MTRRKKFPDSKWHESAKEIASMLGSTDIGEACEGEFQVVLSGRIPALKAIRDVVLEFASKHHYTFHECEAEDKGSLFFYVFANTGLTVYKNGHSVYLNFEWCYL